jgi:hypothetical protein
MNMGSGVEQRLSLSLRLAQNLKAAGIDQFSQMGDKTAWRLEIGMSLVQ